MGAALRLRHPGVTATRSLMPISEPISYTEAEWRAEHAELKKGGDPSPCPWCDRHGFYAPRWAEGNRKYRMCKFCGVSQDVGEQPRKLIRYECRHTNGSVRAGWKPQDELWKCQTCDAVLSPDQSVAWPIDDPKHPWRAAPEKGTQAEYQAFWGQLGADRRPRFGIP
jgi:hypothetical protein